MRCLDQAHHQKFTDVEVPAAAVGDPVGLEDVVANECVHLHHHHSCNIGDACNICGACNACSAFEKAQGRMTPRYLRVERLV